MTWEKRLDGIKVGDTVRFSRPALKRIFSADPMKVSPEGVVTGIEERDGFKFARVEWGEPNVPDLVNVLNLSKARERDR